MISNALAERYADSERMLKRALTDDEKEEIRWSVHESIGAFGVVQYDAAGNASIRGDGSSPDQTWRALDWSTAEDYARHLTNLHGKRGMQFAARVIGPPKEPVLPAPFTFKPRRWPRP